MWRDLTFWNRENKAKLSQLLSRGYHICSDGKIRPRQPGGSFDTPWVFVKRAACHNCSFWHEIVFSTFGIIPSFCRAFCHKVVAKPRNVKELFQLLEIMPSFGIPGKCGVDRRDYTSAPYAAYWYANSMSQGREYYGIVRKGIDEGISPDISVILKKGCTEMEAVLDSDRWHEAMTPHDQEMEMRLEDMFDVGNIEFTQSDWLKSKIKHDWLKTAYAIGDPTWKELVPGGLDIFGFQPVTYHQLPDNEKGKPNLGIDEDAPVVPASKHNLGRTPRQKQVKPQSKGGG